MAEQHIVADVSGRIWKVETEAGQRVEQGSTLLVIESMKMEIPVEAPAAGQVLSILVAEGDMVAEEQPLIVFESD